MQLSTLKSNVTHAFAHTAEAVKSNVSHAKSNVNHAFAHTAGAVKANWQTLSSSKQVVQISSTLETVKANWQNMSTLKKVATLSSTILMVGAGIAALIFGHAGLAALAGLTGIAILAGLHGAVPAVASTCAALALSIPAFSFLKKPAAPKAVEVELAPATPVEVKPEIVEETVVGPTEEATVVEAPVVAPSRLTRLKNASAQIATRSLEFVLSHKLAIAGVTALVLGAPTISQTRLNLPFLLDTKTNTWLAQRFAESTLPLDLL